MIGRSDVSAPERVDDAVGEPMFGHAAAAAAPIRARHGLLLLSPSRGLGGGIERVMDAVETAWPGSVHRVDLLGAAHLRGGAASRPDKTVSRAAIASFTARAFGGAVASKPDVIVCGLLGLLPVATAIALATGRKLALLAYGVDVWGRIGPVERRLIGRCTHLLAISSFTADVFAERAGVDRRGIGVLPLPIANSIADAAQDEVANHAERSPVVLSVSRLARTTRYKGHLDIAACFERVLERRPDARWIVAGHGDDLPALRSRCGQLGIQHAVTFTGRLSDAELISLYRKAAVFALPSYADASADPPVGEGFGLVYVEAGAFGLPIIAAHPGGGSADFVVDGETGLTVNAQAPDELADAIVRLLDDANLRTALGERARSRAFARHLPAHFGDALTQSLS